MSHVLDGGLKKGGGRGRSIIYHTTTHDRTQRMVPSVAKTDCNSTAQRPNETTVVEKEGKKKKKKWGGVGRH